MNTGLVTAMTLALVGLSETPLAVAKTEEDIAALQSPIATVDRFHAALTEGKVEAALKLLSDDVLIYESGRAERSKAEYASHHLKADAEFAGATQRKLVKRACWVGTDTAWLRPKPRRQAPSRGAHLPLPVRRR